MMHVALTSPELTALAGPSTVKVWLTPMPITAQETARVNAPSGLTFPLTALPVDGMSASFLTNVRAGQTVWIGSSLGTNDRGVYRVRSLNATTLFIGEIGIGDLGRHVQNLRSTTITDNDYVTVLTQHDDLWTSFGVIDYDGETATFYKDDSRAYVNENQYPPPIVRLGKHIWTRPDAGQTYATLSMTAEVDLWPTSASATYSWSAPDWTNTSGTTTNTLSGRAPAGWSVVQCTVTENNSNSFVARRKVYVYDSNNPPIDVTAIASDTSTRDGWRMSVQLNDSLLSQIAPGAFCLVHLECTWNGADVASAVVDFAGWVLSERWATTPGLRDGDIEIVGPSAILATINNTSQSIEEVNAAPATWQETVPSLCKARYFIHYLLLYHAPNALALFDLTLDAMDSTDDRLPRLVAPKAKLWEQCKSLAARAFLEFTCDETGALFAGRHPNRTATGSRSTIVNRATLTTSIYRDLSINRRLVPNLGLLEGAANSYSGTGEPMALLSRAPGLKAGQGTGEDTLGQQIVDTQATLNTRTGLEYAYLNAEYESIELTIQKAWTVFSPAQLYFVQVQDDAALLPRNAALDIRAIPLQVSRTYQGGTMDIRITFEPETSGADGVTKPIDPPDNSLNGDYSGGDWAMDQIAPIIEPLPEIDFGAEFTFAPDTLMTLDPKPSAAQQYGRLFGATSEGHVWRWTGNGSGGTFADISPTADQRSAIGAVDVPMRTDPYNLKRWVVRGATGVAFTNDITASTVVWTTAIRTTRKVTFDSGGYSNYRILYGTLVTGGNSGNCLDGGFATGSCASYPSDFTLNVVSVVLPKVSRVTRYKMDHKELINSGTIGCNATFFDAKDSPIVKISLGDAGSTTWKTFDSGPISVRGVARIEFETGACGAAGYNTRTDNLSFTYTDDDGVGTPAGDIQPTLARKNTWYWLSYSGSDLYFNRTLDFFATIQSYRVASYSAGDHVYSFTVKRKDWRVIYVAGGSGAASDRSIYRSVDAGQTWEAVAALNTKSGMPWWNSSTKTANTVNASEANLRHIRGLDNSNNYQLVEGVTGTTIDIVAADATRYAQAALALGFLARDLDIGMYLARTGHTYKTTDSGDTWSAATSVTGGSSFVVYGGFQWPADPQFWGYFGYRCLGYTTNAGTAWTSLWSAYDTFRSGAYGSEGETVISAAPYIGDKYPVPVV